MAVEQEKILENSMAHEALINHALSQHASIVSQVHAQSQSMQLVEAERLEMKRQLESQEKAVQESVAQRLSVMQAVVAQSETMTKTRTAREELLAGISQMGLDVKNVLGSIKVFLPEDRDSKF